jgi:hypothetical protein
MQVIENAAHWALAVCMAAIAYLVSLVLCGFLGFKLLGLQVGVQPSADLHSQIGITGMIILGFIAMFVPLAVATFVGAMTAPFAQRGLAAVVFPVLVFTAMMILLMNGGPHHHGLNTAVLLGTAASCAGPGGLVYVRWRRQRLRIARA